MDNPNNQAPVKIIVGDGRGMPANMPATSGVTQAMGVDGMTFTAAAVPNKGLGPMNPNCPNCEMD